MKKSTRKTESINSDLDKPETKDQGMRERFKKKFLAGGVDSSVQFKKEVRGRLPQEFLKFLDEEIAKAREEGQKRGFGQASNLYAFGKIEKKAREEMGEELDIIILGALLLNDHPSEKIVRKQINKIRQDIKDYLKND